MQSRKTPVQLEDGCAVNDDIAYVSAFPDVLTPDVKFTRLFAFNAKTHEKWFYHDLDGHHVVSTCLKRPRAHAPRAVCALAEDGAVEIANTAGVHLETIAGAGLAPDSRQLGAMTRIREIGEHLYACGTGNQLYRRDDGMWVAIDQPLVANARAAIQDTADMILRLGDTPSQADWQRLSASIGNVGMLDDVGGTSDQDIYACGHDGTLFHWNGSAWQALDARTRNHLHSMHVVSEDEVWICGHRGTLLKGSKANGFATILEPPIQDNFWSVRKFGDAIYIGTSRGLLSFRNGGLTRVELPGSVQPASIQALDSTDDTLWVIADRFLVRLQAGQWERFDHPDNV